METDANILTKGYVKTYLSKFTNHRFLRILTLVETLYSKFVKIKFLL